MSLKRWAVATLGAFVVITGADFVIHEVWLGAFYRAHPTWWRPAAEMNALMGCLFTSHFILAALLTLVYAKGYERGKGGIGQGVRFGVLMGLLLFLPKMLMLHVVYPYPASLLASWTIGGLLEITLASTVIGLLYHPAK
ncbi:MAG: hypothetical protein HYZ88_00980 [Candidatus Omnitrophica bacterium]|nr:hypothetical protein [Candidatus Omnitrophota bacterium]